MFKAMILLLCLVLPISAASASTSKNSIGDVMLSAMLDGINETSLIDICSPSNINDCYGQLVAKVNALEAAVMLCQTIDNSLKHRCNEANVALSIIKPIHDQQKTVRAAKFDVLKNTPIRQHETQN